MHAKDIAKQLGLSPATVSLVLNNKPGISAKTRQRILDAVAGSDFEKKKSQTQNKAMSKSNNICFLIFKRDIHVVIEDSQFFSKVIEGLEKEATEHDYQMNISYISNNAIEGVAPLLNSIREGSICGLIILATEMTDTDVAKIAEVSMDLPVIILDHYTDEKIDAIYLDNINANKKATELLISQGHTEIGFINSTFWIHNMEKRYNSVTHTLAKHSIPFNKQYYYELSPTIDAGKCDMLNYLERAKSLPTAFITANDVLGIAASTAIKEFGLKIPDDISIIGFDDISYSSVVEPRLSTVRIQKERMGRIAVSRLISRIETIIPERITLRLNSDLVIRESVKAIPTAVT